MRRAFSSDRRGPNRCCETVTACLQADCALPLHPFVFVQQLVPLALREDLRVSETLENEQRNQSGYGKIPQSKAGV